MTRNLAARSKEVYALARLLEWGLEAKCIEKEGHSVEEGHNPEDNEQLEEVVDDDKECKESEEQ